MKKLKLEKTSELSFRPFFASKRTDWCSNFGIIVKFLYLIKLSLLEPLRHRISTAILHLASRKIKFVVGGGQQCLGPSQTFLGMTVQNKGTRFIFLSEVRHICIFRRRTEGLDVMMLSSVFKIRKT